MINIKNKIKDNLKLEYIWLDGNETQSLRSKTKVIATTDVTTFNKIPVWNFDGSSTKQAPGNNSECILEPVRIYPSSHPDTYYIFCEVMNIDGTPHTSNTRAQLRKLVETNNDNFWWGFEQEYFLIDPKNNKPIGFPFAGYPEPQGSYYCGVGSKQVSQRHLTNHHLDECLEMGISITGTNAEVALGQWEYQCFAKNTLEACDDLWMSRYILHRLSEDYHIDINMDPKPVQGDWNGSGCHTNFSNAQMRNIGGENYFLNIICQLNNNHLNHIENYGHNNNLRLTGQHETQHISKFSYGIGDRGASIRIPITVEQNDWKGYLEDRRPASNCDPYKVTYTIINSIATTTSHLDNIEEHLQM